MDSWTEYFQDNKKQSNISSYWSFRSNIPKGKQNKNHKFSSRQIVTTQSISNKWMNKMNEWMNEHMQEKGQFKPQLTTNTFNLKMVTLKFIFITFQNLSKMHSTSFKHYFLHEIFSLSLISCSLLCITTEPLNQPQAPRTLQGHSYNLHYVEGVLCLTWSLERQMNGQIN